ncbi:hypothetical protein EYW00_14725 [Leptospira interrogans serovar Copenhageni]|uniref:Uncharacterized protein n=1 Tax=Leptospira interrogans serogroup Icterohaemorrhagiae serovar copenhageni (strain Fiocruz L1-130) TaxID=267671 RepID=Q72N78_LEPIC|nr:conserved hypothetical protein [Leptospira interrogans serovar Copenhageni str. Fiocruz L1-130]KAA5548971.1 hypothetical protein F3G11_16745 [Leptospira interrogans serovar Copenhageni]NUL42641.1 hypothetical protein [Leptospira interrogans serovar Copenhageni]QOI48028.1 hypothetical protein Lepto898_15810 [Leptospira interrogans serovar Icterohaemorrhagiae]WPM73845.1 hypothetical protein FYB70_15805 [Leptospira interrogans serovar Icterohaemorrhagiae]
MRVPTFYFHRKISFYKTNFLHQVLHSGNLYKIKWIQREESMIHFSEKKIVNFTNQFLKCGNYCKLKNRNL